MPPEQPRASPIQPHPCAQLRDFLHNSLAHPVRPCGRSQRLPVKHLDSPQNPALDRPNRNRPTFNRPALDRSSPGRMRATSHRAARSRQLASSRSRSASTCCSASQAGAHSSPGSTASCRCGPGPLTAQMRCLQLQPVRLGARCADVLADSRGALPSVVRRGCGALHRSAPHETRAQPRPGHLRDRRWPGHSRRQHPGARKGWEWLRRVGNGAHHSPAWLVHRPLTPAPRSLSP